MIQTTELGLKVKIRTPYPDMRKHKIIMQNVKTPVCGALAKWCLKEGCNLHCHRQGE